MQTKIRNTIRLNPNLRNKGNRDSTYLSQSKKFLNKFHPRYNDTRWHHFYAMCTGKKNEAYIPEDLFARFVEPALNKDEFATAISDKLSYDNYFKKSDMPKTFYKILDDNYFNADHLKVNKSDSINHLKSMNIELVLKPALASGGGRGIVIANAREIGSLLEADEQYMFGCYIIQEKVNQHPLMAKFHPSSLNTIKIATARVESEIVVIGAFMRFGLKNSRIDNGSQGGLACGISENGMISDHAMDDVLFKRYDKHPDTGVLFKGFRIPNFESVIQLCKSNHQKFLHFTFMGWDIAINEDENPILIEFNLRKQGVNWLQYFNGPLFGEHTNYFLKNYQKQKNRKRYWI